MIKIPFVTSAEELQMRYLGMVFLIVLALVEGCSKDPENPTADLTLAVSPSEVTVEARTIGSKVVTLDSRMNYKLAASASALVQLSFSTSDAEIAQVGGVHPTSGFEGAPNAALDQLDCSSTLVCYHPAEHDTAQLDVECMKVGTTSIEIRGRLTVVEFDVTEAYQYEDATATFEVNCVATGDDGGTGGTFLAVQLVDEWVDGDACSEPPGSEGADIDAIELLDGEGQSVGFCENPFSQVGENTSCGPNDNDSLMSQTGEPDGTYISLAGGRIACEFVRALAPGDSIRIYEVGDDESVTLSMVDFGACMFTGSCEERVIEIVTGSATVELPF